MAAGVGEAIAGAALIGAALQPLVQPVAITDVPQVLQLEHGAGAAQLLQVLQLDAQQRLRCW